jgi:hypothetical protein
VPPARPPLEAPAIRGAPVQAKSRESAKSATRRRTDVPHRPVRAAIVVVGHNQRGRRRRRRASSLVGEATVTPGHRLVSVGSKGRILLVLLVSVVLLLLVVVVGVILVVKRKDRDEKGVTATGAVKAWLLEAQQPSQSSSHRDSKRIVFMGLSVLLGRVVLSTVYDNVNVNVATAGGVARDLPYEVLLLKS